MKNQIRKMVVMILVVVMLGSILSSNVSANGDMALIGKVTVSKEVPCLQNHAVSSEVPAFEKLIITSEEPRAKKEMVSGETPDAGAPDEDIVPREKTVFLIYEVTI